MPPCRRLLQLLLPLLLVSFSASTAGPLPAGPKDLAPRIAVGVRVEINGAFQPDGRFRARKIEIKPEEDADEELGGLIDSVDPFGGALTMLGFSVRVAPGTRLTREGGGGAATLEELVPGLRIKVNGRRAEGGTFLARKIRIRDSRSPEPRIVGAIEALEPPRRGSALARVLGLPVMIDKSTMLTDEEGSERPALWGPGVFDEDDVQFSERNWLGRNLGLAGEAWLRGESLSNEDLDDATSDREITPRFFAVAALLADFQRSLLYLEVAGDREYEVDDGDSFREADEQGNVRVGEAYAVVAGVPGPGFSLALGRQKFFEQRRWYYDNQNLDAVRLYGTWHPFAFQASLSRDLFDDSRNVDDQQKQNRIVEVSWDLNPEVGLHGFYVQRVDRTELQDSPLIVGLRLAGSPGRHLEFWSDLAWEGGLRGRPDPLSGTIVVRRVRAHALDLGCTYRPRVALDPSFTAAFALGSGDDDTATGAGSSDETDGTFRQSGLQSNRGSLNGVVSFRYYGELFDPELSNVRILTLGAGLRPAPPISMDVLFHRYRQDVPSPEIVGDELDADPGGLDTALGDEWDFILGYEPGKAFELRVTAGLFQPGSAFPAGMTAGTILTARARFRF